MPTGTRLGQSLIYEYGPNVRIELGFLVETDTAGNPVHLWRCYRRTGAVDWDEDRQRGKNPIDGKETNVNDFWVEVGRGTEDEMDALAQQEEGSLANGRESR